MKSRRPPSRLIDLTGQTFGRLTVLRRGPSTLAHSAKTKVQTRWYCRCTCGQECLVAGPKLRSGHSASCGCLSRERAAETNRALRDRINQRRYARARELFLAQGLPVPPSLSFKAKT